MKLLKRLVMLCLCLALVAASACAENVTELYSGEGDTYLSFEGTLPDGRLLLCGIREGTDFLTDSYRKAWLKCLNTDRTVSWEWLDGDGGEDWTVYAAVTKDKNIAVLFRRCWEDDNDRIIVKFLNMDGEPTGNELSIPMGSGSLWPDDATASYFRLENQIEMPGEKDENGNPVYGFEMETRDWDGNLVEVSEKYHAFKELCFIRETEKGILLFGSDKDEKGHAKIVKKDSLQGKTLWENTFDFWWPEAEEAMLTRVMDLEDGNFLCRIYERGPGEIASAETRDYLVKLDGKGRVIWSIDCSDNEKEIKYAMAVHDGKIVMYTVPPCKDYIPLGKTPMTFRWYDLDGRELGTTELEVKLEYFPALQEYMAGQKTDEVWDYSFDGMELISMEDGLWGMTWGDIYEEVDTVQDFPFGEVVLIKIPEL